METLGPEALNIKTLGKELTVTKHKAIKQEEMPFELITDACSVTVTHCQPMTMQTVSFTVSPIAK